MRKLLRALESPGPRLEPEEALRGELLALLAEEIAGARGEWERAEKQNREDAALERDACLAPVGATWETLLREQAALDRSIDRKVRIILAMRKDYTRLLRIVAKDPRNQADHQQAQDLNTLLGLDLPFEDTQDENLVEAAKAAEQCANVAENKGSGS
jgi:predicted RNase H-like nuclease (RuvC/YqgF family)